MPTATFPLGPVEKEASETWLALGSLGFFLILFIRVKL